MKLHGNAAKLTGQKFGRLTVTEPVGRSPGSQIIWLCKCDCGGTAKVLTSNLTKGHTRSCGCLWSEAVDQTTHGLSRTVEHHTWTSAKARCYNAKNTRYARYGGRGIVMCRGWIESFESFIADMGPKPSASMTIDRKDNDGNYSCGHCDECIANAWPANCRWATHGEQNSNTSVTLRFDVNGEALTIREIAERCGHSVSVIKQRLCKHGWAVQDAMRLPRHSKKPLYDADLSATKGEQP